MRLFGKDEHFIFVGITSLMSTLALYRERQNLLDRQREGIAIAKREGKYKGGTRKRVDGIGDVYRRIKEKQVSVYSVAKELNISRPTLYKLIHEYEVTINEN